MTELSMSPVLQPLPGETRVALTLGQVVPGLIRPGAARVTDLDGENHFLSRTLNTPGPGRERISVDQAREMGAELGSRFLPFDLEAYTYHPAWGVQKGEFAKMNAGVLKTIDEGAAGTDIGKLILAWYGNSIPTTNPAAFQANYIPPGWPTPGLYGALAAPADARHWAARIYDQISGLKARALAFSSISPRSRRHIKSQSSWTTGSAI